MKYIAIFLAICYYIFLVLPAIIVTKSTLFIFFGLLGAVIIIPAGIYYAVMK